jgi:Transcription factor WhiB
MTSDPAADAAVRALSAALLTLAARDQRTPCQGRYSELWTSEDYTQRAETIPLCAGCELITKCADYATELKASFGVWAGKDWTPRPMKARTA